MSYPAAGWPPSVLQYEIPFHIDIDATQTTMPRALSGTSRNTAGLATSAKTVRPRFSHRRRSSADSINAEKQIEPTGKRVGWSEQILAEGDSHPSSHGRTRARNGGDATRLGAELE